MEAREWRRKPGTFSYRYHPHGGKPIALGTDRQAALKRVLDLTGGGSDEGTCNHLWRLYKESKDWQELSAGTHKDYEQSFRELTKVFGEMHAAHITQPMVRRYMKVERQGKVRANRELAVLSNLMSLAVDYGYVNANPCIGTKRIKETPRDTVPLNAEFGAFLAWLRTRGKQWRVIAAMAEFAAKAGSRRTEFLRATIFQVKGLEARLQRAKQREGKNIVDVIELAPETLAMLQSIRLDGCTTLFPARSGNPYTDSGFNTMWQRALKLARAQGIVTQSFTFHDLRAFYTTEHKKKHGSLPDLHKNPAVTARIYDRTEEARRRAV